MVLTDRNDLDDQLFGTFSRCHELLRQEPEEATSRSELKELLMVASGGVVFTTIQKFLPEEKGDKYPLLSERRNIIVIADEAHRSQYDFIDIYDIEQAVEDGATVRIYYENRLAKLELKQEERPKIDPEFEDVTEGEEVEKKEKLKSKWVRLEAIVGSEKCIN